MRDPLYFIPIRIKLPLAFLLIGLLVLGVGGVLLAHTSHAVVEEQIGRLLSERATAAALLVDQELALLGRRVEDFASDGFIRTSLATLLEEPKAAGPRTALLDHLAENKLPLVAAFVAARLTAPDGRIVLATADWPSGPERAAGSGTRFGALGAGPEGVPGPCFTLSTPVRSITGDRALGRLEILVSASEWKKAIAVARPGPGDGVLRAWIVDATGRSLALGSGPPGRGPEAGPEVLTYTHGLTHGDYSLTVTADRAAALAPLGALTRRILLIGGLALLAMTGVAFFPVHYILRPLQALRDAARRIAEGDFQARVETDSRDEIGELSTAFNEMARALVERTKRIEEAAESVRRKEEEVRYERDRLDAVIRSMYDGLFIVDPQGRVALANAPARPLVEALDSRGVLERRACGRTHPSEESCLTCLADFSRPHQVCVLDVEGRQYEIHATTLPGRNDAVAGRIFVSRDITDRLVEADRQAHQERLSVLGEITAVIAHELNNPLAAIAMFGQMLEAGLPADSPLKEHAEVIRRNAELGRRTIRGLLDMAATPTAELARVDVHEMLEDALKLLEPIWRRAGAEVRLVPGAEAAELAGDELQLRQAVVNLVMNAIQAAQGPGRKIAVSTFEEGERLGIRVADDGPGIPPEVVERIFDPFFTTKPPGVGTGLGLPTARRIAEAHGGTLRLAVSEPGRTEFELLLPRGREVRPIPVWRGKEAGDD